MDMAARERTLGFLSVLAGLSVVLSAGELHRPASLVENPFPLKQRIFKPISDGSDGYDLDPSTLGRLLIRQNTCQARTGLCQTGVCCPIGGDCCRNSRCCNPGHFCYSNGCCENGETGCEQKSCCPAGHNCCIDGGCCDRGETCVIVNGRVGCCPIGQTCSGSPKTCSNAGNVPCPRDNFCCPPGDTCFRGSNNQPLCSAGGAPTPVPTSVPKPAPTPSTTPVSTPSSTPVSTLFITPITPFSSRFNNGSVPQATYTLQPPPVSPAGSTNSTVAATDGRIVYSPEWTTSSTCSAVTRSCNVTGAFMVFSFTGTAVYMNLQLGTSGVVYTAEVDGQTDTVDGYRATDTCGTGWSRFGLASEIHSVTVTIVGPSPNSPVGSSQAGMDFTSFIFTSQASSRTGVGATPTFQLSGARLSTKSSWTAVIVFAIVCAGLAMKTF